MCAVRPAWLDLVSLSYRPLVEKRGRRERRPRECSHALADLHGLHARGRLFARRKDLAVADDRLGRDGGLLVHDRALLGGGVLHDVELGRQRRRGDSSHEKGSENDFLHGLLLGEYSDRGRSDRGIERPSGTPVPSRSPALPLTPTSVVALIIARVSLVALRNGSPHCRSNKPPADRNQSSARVLFGGPCTRR